MTAHKRAPDSPVSAVAVSPGTSFDDARACVAKLLRQFHRDERVVVITEVDIRPAGVAAFRQRATRLKHALRARGGVSMVWCGEARTAPRERDTVPYLMYEDWRTTADLRAHWRSPQLREFYAEVGRWCAAPPKFRILREQEHMMATRVLRTGATKCWDTEGCEITCGDTGQDGEIQSGVPESGPRFRGNGDGTITDTLTDLVWLQDADAFGEVEWEQALSNARGLRHGSYGLSDGSSNGDWRLANIREMLSLIDYGQADPILPQAHRGVFSNIKTAIYWTSTTMTPAPRLAWMMTLGIGPTVFVLKRTPARMWPVRGNSKVVLRTGQEDAYDADGKRLSSAAGSGQDGEIKAGVPLPTAARRFEDQKNGTIKDRLTGLVWLQNADAFGFQSWGHALECCRFLENGHAGLSDGSKPGDWHLPNIREIESLVDYGKRPEEGAPQWPGCVPLGHPFKNMRPSSYWTSTTVAAGPSQAMFIILGVGPSIFEDKDHRFFVWPVRDPFAHEHA